MSDIIRLLPDSVANQIAAGEVIQRPASAVKELLENAVDAGSTNIKLIVKDAGKALVQVIDNGCGMSETDARMSFERHATSKIQKAEDLWKIRTKGFRGEALASIAAVAQVEMRTRKTEDELGTLIEVEGSEVKKQEPVSSQQGTSFSVKNLFFNIPARRNFLKSNPSETRHIIEEFQRVALAHPDISFQLINNGLDVHQLAAGTLRQRIVAVFGSNFNEAIVPVNEETTILNIRGFIGKPEFAKKTRGEQYLFVNQRFVRDPYLNHAVSNAYDQLLAPGTFPSYFIYIEIDPARIDINIHPTKTEIKFDDEKSVYAIVRSAVKHSLGQYSITPSLDFNQENSIQIPVIKQNAPFPKPPSLILNPDYNPFEPTQGARQNERREEWKTFFDKRNSEGISMPGTERKPEEAKKEKSFLEDGFIFQVNKKYIFAQTDLGFLLIDQQSAHERILYERFLNSLTQNKNSSQQELFPRTIELSPENASILKEIENEIQVLGFDVREFGKNSFVVHGIPADLRNADPEEMIEDLIEQYKNFSSELKSDKREKVARTLAKNFAVKPGTELTKIVMTSLMEDLFSCTVKNYSPAGNPVFLNFSENEIQKMFGK